MPGIRIPASTARTWSIGDGETDEAIVIVAHHDTVRGSPGADDNGAGVARLIELASQLSGRSFRRTVILAAPDFEEIGLIGSRYLVRWLRAHYRVAAPSSSTRSGSWTHAGAPGGPGWDRPAVPRPDSPPRCQERAGDTVAAHQTGAHRSGWCANGARAARAATLGADRVLLLRDPLDLPLIGPALLAVPAARHFSRSDHVNFWRAGLPAIQVTNTANFRNPNYHRPTDTPDTLDYETLARITAATALAIERLADADGRMA